MNLPFYKIADYFEYSYKPINLKRHSILFLFFTFLFSSLNTYGQWPQENYQTLKNDLDKGYLNFKLKGKDSLYQIKNHKKIKPLTEEQKLETSFPEVVFKERYFDKLINKPSEIYSILAYVYDFDKNKLTYVKEELSDSSNWFGFVPLKYKDTFGEALDLWIEVKREDKLIKSRLNFYPDYLVFKDKYGVYTYKDRRYEELEIHRINFSPGFLRLKFITDHDFLYDKIQSKIDFDPLEKVYKYSKLDSNYFEFMFLEDQTYKSGDKWIYYNLKSKNTNRVIGLLRLEFVNQNLRRVFLDYDPENIETYYNKHFKENLPIPDTVLAYFYEKSGYYHNNELINNGLASISKHFSGFKFNELKYRRFNIREFKNLSRNQQNFEIMNSLNTLLHLNADSLNVIDTKYITNNESNSFKRFKASTFELFENDKRIEKYLFEDIIDTIQAPLLDFNSYIKIFNKVSPNQSYYPDNDTIKKYQYYEFITNDKQIEKFSLAKSRNKNKLFLEFDTILR